MRPAHHYPSHQLQWWMCEHGHWLHCPGREDTRPRKKELMRLLSSKGVYLSHTHLPTANRRQQNKTQAPVQAEMNQVKDPGSGVPAPCLLLRSLEQQEPGASQLDALRLKKCPPAPHSRLPLPLNRAPE